MGFLQKCSKKFHDRYLPVAIILVFFMFQVLSLHFSSASFLQCLVQENIPTFLEAEMGVAESSSKLANSVHGFSVKV
jgi:hypothetical protein